MTKSRLSLLVLLLITFLLSIFVNPNKVGAAFNPNNIMDDAVFVNSNSMSSADIDSWLNNTFPASCISSNANGNGNSGFSTPDPLGWSASQNKYLYGANVTAGKAIADAANLYHINPRVILATLQKEQSVVSGNAGCHYNSPDPASATNSPCGSAKTPCTVACIYSGGCMNIAMSYGCPNYCAAKDEGFAPQLTLGTWLLRFSQQRAYGILTGYSGYEAGDEGFTYVGPMTAGYRQRVSGGSTIYYDGTYTTQDGTSVNISNGATASLYTYTPFISGNQSYINTYTSWFGSPNLPQVFKVNGDPSIYVQSSGYKFYVPTIAMLQDFGLGTGAQTISSTDASAIPLPDNSTGLSNTLGNVVKSPSDSDGDGGSIYLVSNGKRYLFTTPQQMTDFGFSAANITYLPLSFITSISSGGTLSNFVQLPDTSRFQISNGTKRLILNDTTMSSLNPSGLVSSVSPGVIAPSTALTPSSSTPVLVATDSGAMYLFSNDQYFYIPTPNVLGCWGFGGSLPINSYRLLSSTYVPAIINTQNASCLVSDASNSLYALNGTTKVIVPPSYGFTAPSYSAPLWSVANTLTTRATSLATVLQPINTASLWYLENGIKKQIPSLADLNLLKFPINSIDRVSPGILDYLPGSGLKFGTGQVVRATDTGAIYVITSATDKLYISTPDDFIAYGFSWGSIENFTSSLLDQYNITGSSPLNRYLYTNVGSNYLLDPNRCYGLTASQLIAFGQPTTKSQTYPSTSFPGLNLVNCTNGSTYVKSSASATVYWVDAGIKHSVSSWANLVQKSGTNSPYIITLSPLNLQSIPTGTPL